eukprot:15284-Amphidinium_carterae.1
MVSQPLFCSLRVCMPACMAAGFWRKYAYACACVIQQTGYGRRSDIWGLGCVIIEMATAQHPWGAARNDVCMVLRTPRPARAPQIPKK